MEVAVRAGHLSIVKNSEEEASGVSGLVVECRTYSNPGDVVWIDDITVTCPDDALVFVPDRQPLPYDLYITDAYAVCDGETTTVYYDLVLGICGPPDRGDWAEVILEAAIDFFMNDWYMGCGVQLARYVWEGSCPAQDYSDCGPGWYPAEVGFCCALTGDDVYVIPACRPRSDAYVCHCLVTVESTCPFVYVGTWPLKEGRSDILPSWWTRTTSWPSGTRTTTSSSSSSGRPVPSGPAGAASRRCIGSGWHVRVEGGNAGHATLAADCTDFVAGRDSVPPSNNHLFPFLVRGHPRPCP